MKHYKSHFYALICLFFATNALFVSCNQNTGISGTSLPARIENGMIVFDEPHRAAGQQSMLQFAADPIPVVRVGFVGLGMRGPDAVERFCHIDGTSVVALCDKYEDRAVACQKILSGAGRPEAAVYSGNEGYK